MATVKNYGGRAVKPIVAPMIYSRMSTINNLRTFKIEIIHLATNVTGHVIELSELECRDMILKLAVSYMRDRMPPLPNTASWKERVARSLMELIAEVTSKDGI